MRGCSSRFLFPVVCAVLFVGAVVPGVRGQVSVEIDPRLTQVESAGNTFHVAVDLTDVRNLHAYRVEIFYNPAVLTHTGIEQGSLFDAYDSLFLTSGSDTSRGRILVDHAVLGAHSVSDSLGTAFSVSFEVTGVGQTNLFVADTELRNLENRSLTHTVDSSAVVAVGTVPAAVRTEQFTTEQPGRRWRSFRETGVRVKSERGIRDGMVTAARFDHRPGDSTAVYVEASGETWPDAQVPARYWAITSSASISSYSLSFSYASIEGVEEPGALRVARHSLEDASERSWKLIPEDNTQVDEDRDWIIVRSSSAGKTLEGPSQTVSAQYVIVSAGTKNPLPASNTHGLPVKYSLEKNYPNPFNPRTTIRYGLPRAEEVRIVVFDRLGREVSVLVDGWHRAGYHEATFDGRGLSSGLYVYRLETASTMKTRKMLLAK